MFSDTLNSALIGAGVTVGVAVVGGLSAYAAANRVRRRKIYGDAFRAAMSWVELYYRVRRRSTEPGADDAIRQRFHTAQEEINFYVGWIGSESRWMCRSYGTLVTAIKTATETHIQTAWDQPAQMKTFEPQQIVTSEAQERFLRDVRAHLAWWQIPKLLILWRNRIGQGTK